LLGDVAAEIFRSPSLPAKRAALREASKFIVVIGRLDDTTNAAAAGLRLIRTGNRTMTDCTSDKSGTRAPLLPYGVGVIRSHVIFVYRNRDVVTVWVLGPWEVGVRIVPPLLLQRRTARRIYSGRTKTNDEKEEEEGGGRRRRSLSLLTFVRAHTRERKYCKKTDGRNGFKQLPLIGAVPFKL
jgi:hypothetical protein